MSALVRAEARKVLTTRSSLVISGVVVIYPVLAILPAVLAAEEPTVDTGTLLEILRGGAAVLVLGALLLGILHAAGEYRHGTIVPSLLVAPRRERLLAAKLGLQAVMGMTLGFVVSAVGLVTGASYLTSRGVSVDVLSGDVLLSVAGVVIVATLYATIGGAVGALVRNQTAAVAGMLTWVFAVENAIPIVLTSPGLKRWLPGGAAERLLHLADPLAGTGRPWTALAMLAGVTAVLAGAAVVATKAADIH